MMAQELPTKKRIVPKAEIKLGKDIKMTQFNLCKRFLFCLDPVSRI